VKETRLTSKNLTELVDYITTNGSRANKETVGRMIDDLKDIEVEENDKKLPKYSIDTVFPGSQGISAGQIARLNHLLPWSTLVAFRGALQGAPWDDKKRSAVHRIPDAHIEKLGELIEGKRVLEIGCHEGVYTLGLAKFARTMVALDGRIENIIKTLVRLWLANKLDTVRAVCLDLEELNVPSLNSLIDGYAFDLIHHYGVLYHLSNPLAHLDNILDNNPTRTLFLDTHVATDDQCRATYEYDGSIYNVYQYIEPAARTYSPFAGITPIAVWLHVDDLMAYLQKRGYVHILENTLREERNGLRCRIICAKAQ